MNGKDLLTHSQEKDSHIVTSSAPHWNPNEGESVGQGSGCPFLAKKRAAVDEIFEEDELEKIKGAS